MKTHTWSVVRLDCLPETEIVLAVHWRVTTTEGGHSATVAGATNFAPPVGSPTPFAELTEEIVIGWVKGQLEEEAVDAIEADLAAQVDALAVPPVVAPPLPWQA